MEIEFDPDKSAKNEREPNAACLSNLRQNLNGKKRSAFLMIAFCLWRGSDHGMGAV